MCWMCCVCIHHVHTHSLTIIVQLCGKSSFIKTHIRNAKKRLQTMLRNPEKRANTKALAAHFHLIEGKGLNPEHDHDSDDEDDGLGFGLSQS